MPVRFRCVYCNQLLGISSRKAGTVVRCTNCEGQIIVPEPEAVAAGSAKSANGKEHQPLPNDLLERDDLDDLLRPFDFDGPTPAAAPPEGKQPPCPAPVAAAELPAAITPRTRPVWLNRIAIGWTLTALFALVVGFVIGRNSIPTP